ncbi:hypothetical protein A2833_01890 [Candidatus Azambacteria bacterium RIFCSPHIGHO2_01_FULL_44_55]|uniref:Amidohydrolase-related domain-containing protein n=1 Tax=Candidatus Azambacteria bacterium RIFCSPLOWO2_02_FULL_44_14 TaxID=1797306 RepID=A0A1F5CAZ0_9BACT|nr:MAG: hypothetical protein A3A18_02885 [Candidatus Azambacteria bacterium RIFCSPLOWO2_01_FULL_44_84]OGD39716.1 MAG: hypothetical protein A2833_01890 [Candidatus Azambacteria bacterium RIFCSPHIGHO2_01_FULL_44_55]OGD40046.1 MAG: hypothetical protein A3I30_02345 [Candidatus Azambacteria bacterium RIFCSPLOWO2_02_FULL_44_14]
MMIYADTLAFLAEQGTPPVASPELKLDLCHVTSAAPFSRKRKGEPPLIEETLEEHRGFMTTIVSQPKLRIVRSRADLMNLGSTTKVICGLQMPPADISYTSLRILKDNGVHVICIAYHEDNKFGSGFLNPYGPLTNEGRKFIEWCAEVGMILDLCQASHQTAWDALEHIKSKGINVAVMASHTGIYGAADCYNPRNLPKEIIYEIARLGGVVGIFTLTFGLSSRDNSLNAFFMHLQTAVRSCGIGNVTIGSDAVYQIRPLETWQVRYRWLAENIDPQNRLRHRWPDQPLEINGSDILGVIKQHLESGQNSYIDRPWMIEALLGLNLWTFFARNLK